MIYQPYETQKRQKNEHQNTILALLHEQQKTFSQLEKSTGFSPSGLTKMLKELEKDGKIEKSDSKNKKSPYKIKNSGLKAKDFLYPGKDIAELRDDGKYYVDIPDYHMSDAFEYSPGFGITTHMLMDRKIAKKYKPFWRKEIVDIEKFVFDTLKQRHENEWIIDEKLLEDKKINKKFFLVMEFDYNEIMKIIEKRSDRKNTELVKEHINQMGWTV